MKKLLGIVAVAAVVAAAPAYATNGMRLTGFGPVQQSMGGASVAAPLDAVTAVTNPAGLSLLAPQIEVAGAAFSPTVKYDIGGQGATSSRPTDFLPTLAAAFRANDAITVGVAALGTAGMGVDYKDFGGPGAEMMSSYLNGRIAPAVAYKVNDQLSAGLALNLMYAQMKFALPTPAGEVSRTFVTTRTGDTVRVTVDQPPLLWHLLLVGIESVESVDGGTAADHELGTLIAPDSGTRTMTIVCRNHSA